MGGMDSSSAAQFELLVAVEGVIEYKNERMGDLKPKAEGSVKKPYREPKLVVYGDVRTMTRTVSSTSPNSDGATVFGQPLKTH